MFIFQPYKPTVSKYLELYLKLRCLLNRKTNSDSEVAQMQEAMKSAAKKTGLAQEELDSIFSSEWVRVDFKLLGERVSEELYDRCEVCKHRLPNKRCDIYNDRLVVCDKFEE